MQVSSKIQQRAVRIINANNGNSIGTQLSAIAGITHTELNVSNVTVDEERTPFLLDKDSFGFAIDNEISTLGNAFGGATAKGGSKFSTVASFIPKAAEALSALASGDDYGAAWNPWFLNIPTWQGTKVQDLDLSFSFKLGQYGLWNAEKEVVLPMLALLIPTIPRKLDNFMMQGPFPSTIALLGQFVDVLGAPSEGDATEFSAALASNIAETLKKSTYHISIGNVFSLMYAVPTRADVTFSTDLDTKGMPISGSLKIKYQGAVPPALSHGTDVPVGLRFGTTGGR